MKKNTSNNYNNFKDLIKQEETKALADFNPNIEIKIPEDIQKMRIKEIKQSEAIKLAKNTFKENNNKRTFKNKTTGNKIKVVADDIKESIHKTFSNKNQKKYLKESSRNYYKSYQHDRGESYYPIIGDIIFLDWYDENGNQDGTSDHVGIVTRTDITNRNIYTIEGNTSNKCAEKMYSFDDVQVMGYGSPKYE